MQADDYILPHRRPGSAARDSNPPIEIDDGGGSGMSGFANAIDIDVCNGNGDIVGKMEIHM